MTPVNSNLHWKPTVEHEEKAITPRPREQNILLANMQRICFPYLQVFVAHVAERNKAFSTTIQRGKYAMLIKMEEPPNLAR